MPGVPRSTQANEALVGLGLAGVGRRDRRRPLVGRRVRLGDLGRLRRVALVRRRIRGTGFVRDDHDRLLYRKTRAANPLVGAGEPLGELVLDALHLLLELHQPVPGLLLVGLVAAPDGVAERPDSRATLDGDRIEPRPRAPAAEHGVELRPPDLGGRRGVCAPVRREARGVSRPGVLAAAGGLRERSEQDDRRQQQDDAPHPASCREQADRGSERREAEAEEDEAQRHPQPAPFDALADDWACDGLERGQLCYGSATVRTKASAESERPTAPSARAVPDRRGAHSVLVPRRPVLVTPLQPAYGAAPPARDSPRPRSCPSGGRTRAPSALRVRDPAPPRGPAASAPPARARRAGRWPEPGRAGTDARRRRRRRPRASPRRQGPSPRQIPAGAAPAAYRAARRRCSTASGHIAISAPATKTKPATQMRLTSGLTKTWRSMLVVCLPASAAFVKTSPSERGSW